MGRLAVALACVALAACSAGGNPPPMDSGSPDATPADTGPAPRPDAGPRDAGPDATPCGLERTLCEGGCTDLANDPTHCGACGTRCPGVDDASSLCRDARCEFVCDRGFDEVDGACLPAPRLLWPPSLSTSVTQTPTFRWTLPDGLSDATLEVCSDPVCATVLESASSAVAEASAASPLPAGMVFWRVRSDGRASPTWALRVGTRSIDASRAWGIEPDTNRDGFADIAVGAPRVDDEEGRVYVFLGASVGPSASPTSILRSPAGEGALFGVALAWLGDLDGDGFGELGVGAPQAGDNTGQVFVYFGGPDGLRDTPDLIIDAPDGADSLFGASLAGLGDVDGDGYGDALLGASGDGLTPGRAYLWLGGIDRESGIDQTLSLGGRFASSLAGVGDVDGDGFADALVGAFATASSAGAAYLYRGGTDGLSAAADVTYVGPDGPGAQFGFTVAGAGDLDGDGYPELAVASPASESSRGRVHVFSGSPDPEPVAQVSIDGINSGGGFFGYALGAAGDTNGDGFADLAVGAFGVNGRRGRAVVFRGGEGGVTASERVEVAGLGDGHDFGWALMSGDIDGNGRTDLVVGAPGADSRGGRAYVLRGTSTGVEASPFVTLIGSSGGAFGRALASSPR